MLAVKKLSTNFTFLNCLKMGLFFSWNVDDSQQSGGPKDHAPDPRTVQTGVSPQHPVALRWLAPSEPLPLTYHLLPGTSRQRALLGWGPWGAPRAISEGSPWCNLPCFISIFIDLSSGVLVNCLWDKTWIPSTLLVCPCTYPRGRMTWHWRSDHVMLSTDTGPFLAWWKQDVFA